MNKPAPGPSSEVPDTTRHRALSAASRVRILDLIRRAEDGLTAPQVVEVTGLHSSTVRAHLEQLTESGLLARDRRSDGTPGRPAWRYHTSSAEPAPRHRADAPLRGLAGALVAHLARDAEDPHAAGVRAGRDWGRSLAAPHTAARSRKQPTPADGVVRVLDQLGFSPRVDPQPSRHGVHIALRSCPFLDLALAHPDVVCGLHEGLIGGVLGAFGGSAADAGLEPFALPGACLVRVRTGQHRTRPERDRRPAQAPPARRLEEGTESA